MPDVDGAVVDAGIPPAVSDEGSGTRVQAPNDNAQGAVPAVPESLEESNANLLRGLTEKAQEAGRLRTELDATRKSQLELQQLLSNPDYLDSVAAHLRKQQGQQNGNGHADLKTVAEKHGVGTDLAVAITGMMQDLGYVRRDDPGLTQAQQSLNILTQRTVQNDWKILEREYPGADKYRDEVFDLVGRSNGAIDLEQALHARTKGSLAVAKKAQAETNDIQIRRDAQVPRTAAGRVTTPKEDTTYPETQAGLVQAMYDAAREQKLDVRNIPFMRNAKL